MNAQSRSRPDRQPGPVSPTLDRIGDAVLRPVLGVRTLTGVAVAAILQAVQPATWRRTVRAEFVRHCWEMGITALPAVLLVGALVGLGLVLQAEYWLGLFGQGDVVGQLIVLVLVRELAPLIVGLLMVGRSASVVLTELHALSRDGRLRALDAMGVDPFHFLVLPRVFAMATSCFCLNVALLGAALVVGHLGASSVGLNQLPLLAFLRDVLGQMGLGEFAITAGKPLLSGFVIALIACTMALQPSEHTRRQRVLLARGFVAAMTAVLVISGLLSAVL